MMDAQPFRLINQTIRQEAARVVLTAPDGYMCVIKPATRSLVQNAKLHALFANIAKSAQWHGRTLTAHQWKVLMISGHAIATGLGADMVPGIEGEFVNIRESSASMSVTRMNSLIEYVLAWGAVSGIRFSDEMYVPGWYRDKEAA